MKKLFTQISIITVFAVLGFLIIFQYKLLTGKTTVSDDTQSNDVLLNEITSLKNEKEELINSNNSLSEQVKNYEKDASDSGNISEDIQKQLVNYKMELGLSKVQGSGIIIQITPKTSTFKSSNSDNITLLSDKDLNYIVNVLNFAGAEAVSINDFRITTQTGIKVSGNYISIGKAGRVSPNDTITIKAIGDKTNLKVGIQFQGLLESLVGANYTPTIIDSDDITIDKTSQEISSDYLQEGDK